MPEETIIDGELLQAYRQTSYGVEGHEPFMLRIGQASQALRGLYREHGCDCAAYVTAFNPYSEGESAQRNEENQTRLRTELAARGFQFLPGVGVGADPQWRGEPSFLVLGVTLQQARDLGNRYLQNAIIWCGADAVPQLVLLR